MRLPSITLRELRLRAGLTQRQLAKCSGLSVSTISRYERMRMPAGLIVIFKRKRYQLT